MCEKVDMDIATVLQQLGVMPAPRQSAKTTVRLGPVKLQVEAQMLTGSKPSVCQPLPAEVRIPIRWADNRQVARDSQSPSRHVVGACSRRRVDEVHLL